MSADQLSASKTVLINGSWVEIPHESVTIAASFAGHASADGPFFFPGKMEMERFITTTHTPKSILWHERTLFRDAVTWQGVFMLLVFMLLVFSRVYYPRRFSQLLKGAFSNSAFMQLIREWNPWKNFLSYLFLLSYAFVLTLVIQSLMQDLGISELLSTSELHDFALVSGLILFIIAGKYVTILFVAWLFNRLNAGYRYFSNQIVFSFIHTVAVFPLLLILVFSPSEWSLIAVLSVLIVLQLVRVVRSFVIGLNERGFHLLYLFLYLCALEIVPLLLLAKTLTLLSKGIEIG
jgi:hypothetical protein